MSVRWCVLLALLLAACARPGHRSEGRGDAGAPVDPLLLAFLSRARAAHHLADSRLAAHDLPAAIADLEALVNGPRPHAPRVPAPEVREVLADTFARLADLRSQTGAYAGALDDVRTGLTFAPTPSYFRGHLFEVEGLVEERQAKALEASDPEASRRARERAVHAFELAMSVQARVIEGVGPAPSASSSVGGLSRPDAPR